MAEEEKKKQEQLAKGIDLEAYDDEERLKEAEEKEPLGVSEGKLGSLEVVDGPTEEELEKERERLRQIKEEGQKAAEEKEESDAGEPLEGGIELSQEEEKLVDERVEDILHPKEENEENNEGLTPGEPKESSGEKDLLEAEMEEESKNKKQNKNR